MNLNSKMLKAALNEKLNLKVSLQELKREIYYEELTFPISNDKVLLEINEAIDLITKVIEKHNKGLIDIIKDESGE